MLEKPLIYRTHLPWLSFVTMAWKGHLMLKVESNQVPPLVNPLQALGTQGLPLEGECRSLVMGLCCCIGQAASVYSVSI